jgi:peptidyl-prolyl cis-trans isomerase C
MAAQAVEAGLDKDPEVVAKLRLARERVLTDARLAQLEKQAPDKAALEKVALAEYRTQTDKYVIPEQVRVRHILIDARSCEAEKRIMELLEKAKSPGADFAALATAHSDDAASAKQGGDLGFFERGRTAAEFEKAAFALTRPGELSGVIRTKFGFHILRLEERRPAGREPFEKVRASIVQDLERREQRTRRAQITDPITESLRLDPAAIEALAKRAP